MTTFHQPSTDVVLDQFFRSFARPECDRRLEDQSEQLGDRSARLSVRSTIADLDFLECMHRFLHLEVRRLEQRLDDAHVLMNRGGCTRVPDTLEIARYKYDDAVATRTRMERYLVHVVKSVEAVADFAEKETLRGETRDLRQRINDLDEPLQTIGMRLARYSQLLAVEASV